MGDSDVTSHEPQEETRQSFHELLGRVKSDAGALGALVLENTRRAADALLENDSSLAEAVIAADEEIDARYVDLERQVFEIMATQAPVAGDMRALATALWLYHTGREADALKVLKEIVDDVMGETTFGALEL